MTSFKTLGLSFIVAISYFLFAKLGLFFAFEQANTSPIWPPTGLAIAVVLYYGYKLLPAIFISALAVNLTTNIPLISATFIGVGNTAEAALASFIILKVIHQYPFSSIKSTLSFTAITVICTTISASIGVFVLLLSDIITVENFTGLWITWWLGDAVGGLVFGSLILTFFYQTSYSFNERKFYELIALLLFSFTSTYFVFHHWDNINQAHYGFSVLLLPTIVWASLRFYQRGATSIVLFYTLISVYSTLQGQGPFVMVNITESLLLLQLFMVIILITALTLAASIDETKQISIKLNNTYNEQENLIAKRTIDLSNANSRLTTEINHRQHYNELIKKLLVASSLPSNQDYFQSVTSTLTQIYDTHFAFIGIFENEQKNSVRTISVCAGDQHVDNFTYQLKGTPCQDVLNLNLELVPFDVAQLYPEDKLLVDMAIESYFGAPIISPNNEMIGLVVVMDTKAMILQTWIKPVLKVIAKQVSHEIERHNIKQELQLAASVFNKTVEAIVIYNAQKRILRVNPAFCKVTGYSTQEALGKSPRLLNSGKHSISFYKKVWQSLLDNGAWQGEIWDKRKSGEIFPCWQTITAVKDEKGKIIQYISVFSDIGKKKADKEQIFQLAHFDILTGLPNRTSFIKQFNQILETAPKEPFSLALLFLDIDHFKLINDSSGHSTGDLLLIKIAERLEKLTDKNNILSRFGGDDFVLLIKNYGSITDLENYATNILQELSFPFILNSHETVISASIGYCTFPEDANNVKELLKNADIAMYVAKDEGRNQIKRFTSIMNIEAQQRVEIEHELRVALKNQQFEIYYQPQMQLNNNQFIGCEALLRWQHPQKGMLPPDFFIPIAEESGLIVPIGNWVLEEACKQYIAWQEQGFKLNHIAVNLSARQFFDQDLEFIVQEILQRTGMPANALELELTESMLMENVDQTINTMNKLRNIGIQLSIDDFGTGYSSMAYLKHFPIDKLKIDKSFVDDLLSSTKDDALVNSMINLAHGLGLLVIAEGVENKEQLAYLKSQQCDEIQGYYFSKPQPINAEILLKLLNNTKINKIKSSA